jgi:hypothetical protein
MAKQSNRQAQKRREAKRRKRATRQRSRPGLESIVQELEGGDPADDLAARIFAIAEDWLEQVPDVQERGVMELAVLCWNLGALDVAPADPRLERSVANVMDIGRKDVASIIDEVRAMVARKHWLYPDDDRCVLDFTLEGEGDSVFLTVEAIFLSELPATAVQSLLNQLLGVVPAGAALPSAPRRADQRAR